MMLLLFVQYSRDGGSSIRIGSADVVKLLPQMPKYFPLHRNSRSRNRPNAHRTSEEAQHISANTTQVIAAASRQSSPPQFLGKDRSMPLFMEFLSFYACLPPLKTSSEAKQSPRKIDRPHHAIDDLAAYPDIVFYLLNKHFTGPSRRRALLRHVALACPYCARHFLSYRYY